MNSTNRWIYIRACDDLRRLKLDFAELFPIIKPSKSGRAKRGLSLIAAGLPQIAAGLPLIAAGLLGSAAAGLGLGSACFLGVFCGSDRMSKKTSIMVQCNTCRACIVIGFVYKMLQMTNCTWLDHS